MNPPAFGAGGILDRFDRANGLLAGAATNWIDWLGEAPMSIAGQTVAGALGSFNGAGWRPPVGPNSDTFVTVSTLPGGVLHATVGARLTAIDTANPSGYVFETLPATGVGILIRIDAGANTTILTLPTQVISAGDGIGLRAYYNQLSCWYRSGLGGTFVQLGPAVTDKTYSAGGPTMEIEGTVGRLDDFGGGTIPEMIPNPRIGRSRRTSW